MGLVLCATLTGGELAPGTVAKLLKIVVSLPEGVGKVHSLDAEVAAELAKANVATSNDARVVYALSDADVSKYAKEGRLVVCGNVDQLKQGAALAFVAEGGRPAIYLSHANLNASKINVPDSVIKLAKVAK